MIHFIKDRCKRDIRDMIYKVLKATDIVIKGNTTLIVATQLKYMCYQGK